MVSASVLTHLGRASGKVQNSKRKILGLCFNTPSGDCITDRKSEVHGRGLLRSLLCTL